MLRPRIRRTSRSPVVVDFLRADKVLPDFITFARADATPCATRRRINGSVGPSRTNKCLNANANPVQAGAGTMRVAVSNAALVVTVEDDKAALEAAGLHGLCTSGKVYKATNTGATDYFVQIGGTTGNLAQHTGSAWIRGDAVGVRHGYTTGTTFAASAVYVRRAHTFTPGATTDQLWLTVGAGLTIYFILNQLEEGASATAVIAGDTLGAAKIVTAAPYGDLEVLAANAPRIEYATDGLPRGLLVEPRRVNYTRNGRDFNAAFWTKGGTAPPTVAPGALSAFGGTASLITRTAGGTSYMNSTTGGAGPTGAVVATLIAKAGGVGNRVGVRVQGTYPNRLDAIFDLSNGTVVGTSNSGTAAGVAASIKALEDGFYACTVSGVLADALSQTIFSPCSSNEVVSGFENVSAVASTCYAYALWSEAGSFPTSMIDAAGATFVAREAESCTIANLANINWNANGWSGLVEWEQSLSAAVAATASGRIFDIAEGTAYANSVNLRQVPGHKLTLTVRSGGADALQSELAGVVLTPGQIARAALTVRPYGIAVSVNGSAVQTFSLAVPTAALNRLACAGVDRDELDPVEQLVESVP